MQVTVYPLTDLLRVAGILDILVRTEFATIWFTIYLNIKFEVITTSIDANTSVKG